MVVTRRMAAKMKEENAPTSSSSGEDEAACSSSASEQQQQQLVHDAAVQASRNVPLRSRRRGRAEQTDKLNWAHNHEFHALPDYLRDNEFIQRFYRRPGMPLRKSLLSLFGIHNETGNIWSHLIGKCRHLSVAS